MKKPIGSKLRTARKKVGYTREQATDRANKLLPEGRQFAYATLTRIENGAIKEPSLLTLAALARVYKIELSDIDLDLRDEARQVADLFDRACAPWESNPEPADSDSPFALAA